MSGQFVLPRNVYVGDTATIRYVFESNVDILCDGGGESAFLELPSDFPAFSAVSDKCMVKKASVSREGGVFTLEIEAVFWQPGDVFFPPLDLGKMVNAAKEGVSAPPFRLDLECVSVGSIVASSGNPSFLPQRPPLLLPGTNAVLLIFSSLSILFFASLIFFLLKVRAVSAFFRNFFLVLSMRKNSRVSVRKFRRLLRDSPKIGDCEFALRFQTILRNFLEVHLGEDFSSTTTGDFSRAFSRIFLDDVPIEFERFVDIFARTDYIRFARGLPDSDFIDTEEIDERKNLVEEVVFTISALGREVGKGGVV